MQKLNQELRELASLYGVQTAYNDINGQRRNISAEALLATLKALGAPATKLDDIPSATRERRQSQWQNHIEQTLVAWNGRLPNISLRLQSALAINSLKATIILENGEESEWHYQVSDLPVRQNAEIEGINYTVTSFKIPAKLPLGYHQLAVEIGKRISTALIISAPLKAYSDTNLRDHPYWGVFVPLYALRTANSWGGGDFNDLGTLINWVHNLGAEFVATLPLVSTFFDNTCDLSPYFPASRLFWSELYLNMRLLLEEQTCPAATDTMNSPQFREALRVLQKRATVDYRTQMDLKRHIIEQLAREFFRQDTMQLHKYHHYVSDNPLVDDYAKFRAACEKRGAYWQSWLNPQKDGVLTPGDYDEDTKNYYIYAQWLADEQLKAVSRNAASKNIKLYFDLPLGVSPNSYDVWRERKSFINNISAGAPPDSFFTKGQKWGTAPLHPEGLRQERYRYFIACLRHNLKYAGILRIDHIMAFHRLYVIPDGFDAHQGVYIRYHAPDFYAITSLESHRTGSTILGEDLGTVPEEVRKTMQKHDFYRHYVVQYEINPCKSPFSKVPENVIASINTHDMPTFTAFWQGDDIQQRYDLQLLDHDGVKTESRKRQLTRKRVIQFLIKKGLVREPSADTRSILRGVLSFLSSSKARVMLINLEDLWLETRPQNMPGVVSENLNYCRMLQYTFEEFSQMPEVVELLSEVNQRRRNSLTQSA